MVIFLFLEDEFIAIINNNVQTSNTHVHALTSRYRMTTTASASNLNTKHVMSQTIVSCFE